jgi:hypothetical protein
MGRAPALERHSQFDCVSCQYGMPPPAGFCQVVQMISSGITVSPECETSRPTLASPTSPLHLEDIGWGEVMGAHSKKGLLREQVDREDDNSLPCLRAASLITVATLLTYNFAFCIYKPFFWVSLPMGVISPIWPVCTYTSPLWMSLLYGSHPADRRAYIELFISIFMDTHAWRPRWILVREDFWF